MSAVEDRPSIREQYGSAVGAGVHTNVILAAAMQPHGLGATLLRLQAEYDTVRADLERAGEIAAQGEVELRKAERRTDEEGRGLAEALRHRTEVEIITARCLILMHLKTLHEAKTAIGAYAIGLAERRGFTKPPEVVLKLAGRVIDVWLDPVCAPCDGTGQVGSGYEGKVWKKCDACAGTGRRSERMWTHASRDQWFALDLLDDLKRQMSRAAAGMKDRLRNS